MVVKRRVLVTGGAGFVGSHLVDALAALGHEVTLLDALDPQVHGADRRPPPYLHPDCRLVVGDVRDIEVLRDLVGSAEVIFHLAAAVGVGQSMYEIDRYVSVNVQGTANLLQALHDTHARPHRLIVASSMSVYGEGRGRCTACGEEPAAPGRTPERLAAHLWEVPCPLCGEPLAPLPTSESKGPSTSSYYALSKKDQEEMCLLFGRTYGVPVVALRYFNIYGARQALSNPYTGVVAIFSSRLLNGRPPPLFEDGLQRRDFVSVRDVTRANLLAMERVEAVGHAINIGSGRAATVREVARIIAQQLGRSIEPEVIRRHRAGDIRHCFADLSLGRRLLGYQPTVSLEAGLEELVAWLSNQRAEDRVAHATAQLERRGLTL